MNQQQLIDTINEKTRVMTKTGIKEVLDALAEVAQRELSLDDGEIPLPGIGKLKSITKAARTGRNPATGEEIQIPAKNTAKFVPAKALLDAIA